MNQMSLEQELKSNAYPGRGIVIGRSEDGTKAVTAYFIMGRSANSRNRVFAEDGKESAPRHLPRQAGGPKPDYICPCAGSWKQDHCDQRGPDRHYLRRNGPPDDL